MKKLFIITTVEKENTNTFKSLIQLIQQHYKIEYKIHYYNDILLDYDQNTLTILYLSDENIKLFMKNHLTSGMKIAILPTSDNIHAQASYGISGDIHEALADALEKNRLSKIDILLCNGEPVFTNVIIADVHELNNSKLQTLTLFGKIKSTLSNLSNIEFKEFTITTAKEQIIKTAATGIMVFEHNAKQGQYSIINEDLSLHDGQLNAFILAPSSILSYIYYLLIVFFHNKFSIKTLPKSIGIIKSSKILIESPKPLDYKIDGIIATSKSLDLSIIQDGLEISLGRNIKHIPSEEKIAQTKETVKIQNLPKGEIKNILIAKKIPFFKKAAEDDFKELFLSLKQSANLSSVYLVLMVLSTLLATTGLFQSSAPVIIGAMILAPLMAPIVSLAMGVVRGETFLIKNSSKTLFYGIVTALVFSCVYTYFMPLSTITPEIRGRLNPNVLDLMVAVISGIAGAYANAKSEVAKSLAGVAIAVALVPPLSVTGIGIGWGDFDVIYGSFLLFVTNLVGITLSAALTFIVLGYAPVHRAKKGLLYTSVILVLISIPLIASFSKLIEQNEIRNSINNKYSLNEKKILIKVLDIDLSTQMPTIQIETVCDKVLNQNDLKQLQQTIKKQLDKNVQLEVITKTIVE